MELHARALARSLGKRSANEAYRSTLGCQDRHCKNTPLQRLRMRRPRTGAGAGVMAGNSGFGVGIDKQVESDKWVGVRRRAFDAACRSENALQQIIEGKHLAHGNRDLAIDDKRLRFDGLSAVISGKITAERLPAAVLLLPSANQAAKAVIGAPHCIACQWESRAEESSHLTEGGFNRQRHRETPALRVRFPPEAAPTGHRAF